MTTESEMRRTGRMKHSQRVTSADRYVGARIRERRIMMGLSQQQLGKVIDLTSQQVHKYELGLNRISAGRLFEIAQVLGVPVSWFFEGLVEKGDAQEMSSRQRMCLELARNFALIDNEKHQEALSQMARALAAQSQAANQAAAPAAPAEPPAAAATTTTERH
jgi:transcriptional regulator with XRE-family HTH domain